MFKVGKKKEKKRERTYESRLRAENIKDLELKMGQKFQIKGIIT
jgi:hypothetical protein